MQTIDWTEIFERYKGKWVALADDEITVIAADENGKEAYRKAREKGFKIPIMLHVPQKSYLSIGGAFQL